MATTLLLSLLSAGKAKTGLSLSCQLLPFINRYTATVAATPLTAVEVTLGELVLVVWLALCAAC